MVPGYEVAIIGGGIVGLATAMALTERVPGPKVTVLEKEPRVAAHQSGRNSGVIHSGLYYRPGSLRATLCREGVARLVRFCDDRGVAYTRDGKVVVATSEA
ncbi:MAG: FAD-dependent oxidoreductase, partial [bacterium]|nr:FAD-dependent oxidoreductase [bacterium]